MGNCLTQGDSPETGRERTSQVDAVAVTVGCGLGGQPEVVNALYTSVVTTYIIKNQACVEPYPLRVLVHTQTSYLFSGKNQPLQPTLPVWTSEAPITRGQLLSKRDEFWDTAPMFDGRKEIWDALKAAAYALENRDIKLAQAVVDGANISLPKGSLSDCYDELGNKYQLPVYVLSVPTNLVVEADDCDDGDGLNDDLELAGEDTSLKLRLSSGKDVKIVVKTTETVAKAKQKLSSAEFDGSLESSQQRWFFGGKVLGDKLHIEDAKIPRGHVVQVVLAVSIVPTAAQQQPPPPATSVQPDKSDMVHVAQEQPTEEVELGGGDTGAQKSVIAESLLPQDGQQPTEGAVSLTPREQQQQREGVAAQASPGQISTCPTPVGS